MEGFIIWKIPYREDEGLIMFNTRMQIYLEKLTVTEPSFPAIPGV